MTDFAGDAPEPRFSRHRALQAAKTFFWVFIVTVLIWIYADLEKTEREDFYAKLRLSLGTRRDLAFLSGTDMRRQEVEVRFTASGSRRGLDRCRKALADANHVLTADLSGASPGSVPVDVAEVLRRAEAVRGEGLAIESVNPGAVVVELDSVIYVPDVEVRFRSTGAELAESRVHPPQMGLAVARTRWEELLRSGTKPVLETAVVNLQGLTIDANRPITVALVPFVSRVPVEPNQPTVEVELKLSQATVQKKLKVAVRIVSPADWDEDDTWQRFVLKREDPLAWRQMELTFRGPQKEIEKLRPEDVDAYVVLREEDKVRTESWLPHPVEVRVPPDSQVQFVGPKPSLNLRLDPRPAAPSP